MRSIRGLRGEEAREIVRDDFEFRGVGAGVFQLLHAVIELRGFLDGAVDGAVAGPGDMPRGHAEMPDDGDAFARHRLDDEGAGRAIDAAGADLERAEGDADRFLRRSPPVRRGAGEEAVRGRGDERRQTRLGLGTVEAATHQINAGLLRGGGFLRGFDVDVREEAFALELREIEDGVFFAGAEHGQGRSREEGSSL